jgi:hypothetical protein
MSTVQTMAGVWTALTAVPYTSGNAVTFSGIEHPENLVIIATSQAELSGVASGVMVLNSGEFPIGPRAYTSPLFSGIYCITGIDAKRVQMFNGSITLTANNSGFMYAIEAKR